MTFEINNADNHLQLFALTDAITAKELQEALENLKDDLEDNPYLIFDMSQIILIEKKAKEMINNLAKELTSHRGLMLIATLSDNLSDGIGVEVVPSLQEAIDLIFMDQLEKELEEEL